MYEQDMLKVHKNLEANTKQRRAHFHSDGLLALLTLKAAPARSAIKIPMPWNLQPKLQPHATT